MRTVHGGVRHDLLDLAAGACLHSTLAVGEVYTTLETKVNLVRTIRPAGPEVRARTARKSQAEPDYSRPVPRSNVSRRRVRRGEELRMDTPPIVSREEWDAAREELLAKEKELTRARDALAAERRRLPMVEVEKEYRFEWPEGKASLLDLFEGRRQLIVYRFFLDPGMKITDYPEGCPGCTFFADNLPNLIHLNARDTTLAFASAGSQEAIRDYRTRMGWADWPWYTTADDFSADFDVAEYYGINVFLRDGPRIYRSFYTTGRAVEDLASVWGLLDITPFGRQEEWQDAPEGVPQDRTGSWMRRNDMYSPEELAGGSTR